VCDHWFAALPLGTQANRLMAMGGQSSLVDNASVFLPEQPLVYDWLTEHGVPWCCYQSGDFMPFFSLMPKWLPEIVSSLTLDSVGIRGRFRRFAKFGEHWKDAGTDMPRVIFIEPEYTDGPHSDPNDDHPPTGIAKGQAFLADIYNTLLANPARWAKTMMIVTYDEHGGFFDHVPPIAMQTMVSGQEFTTTGIRVPAFVISPQVTAGTVFSEPLDHTSMLQLLADACNPGGDYSAAVGSRQPSLGRLASLLPALPPANIACNPIPAATLSALAAMPANAAPASTPTQNTVAFNNAAIKAFRDHPELMKQNAWGKLADYIARGE
jgi:phospholipase C